MTVKNFHGIPRERIFWNPSIDPVLCVGCGECLEVCANGVFEFSEQSGKAVVRNPLNCVVLCDKCAQLCPVKAISFPDKDETQKLLIHIFSSGKNSEANEANTENADTRKQLEL